MATALSEIIHSEIKAKGPLTMADFMALCLTHPVHGYYATRDPFGAEGDFTTAPEMTQVFGELIGLWCAEVWQQLGSPKRFTLCELGPGRGTLMKDALRAGKLVPGFVEAAQVHLLESSGLLRKKQADALAGYNPVWLDNLESLPAQPVIMLANEFFDALPIRQFQRIATGWKERRVALSPQGTLVIVLMDAIDSPTYDAPDGTIIEISPVAVEMGNALARPIVKNTGAALVIDYGDDEIIGETLQAVHKHRAAHLLTTPGIADITAHVSFEPIRLAMRKIGTKTYGLETLANFLNGLGIMPRTLQLLEKADEAQKRSLQAAMLRLVDTAEPSSMGRLFKVMAITDRNGKTPPGF